MNYQQAEEYLSTFVDYERIPAVSSAPPDYGLKHVRQLLQLMGDPHLAVKTVHIAGTKGKGSVAAMIAQVLTVAGYKTGLYTSPHLHSLRERIRIDGRLISEEELAALTATAQPYFEAINAATAGQSSGISEGEAGQAGQRLTFYEALTALAFSYFESNGADFQVLEVGLGGRLDATNVANPEVSIITPISLDHTQILGNSLTEIALEKAGIIKPGSLVVLSPQPEEAASAINDVCRKQGAKVVRVGRDITWQATGGDLKHQSLVVHGRSGDHNLSIPLLGDYQLENAAVAVAALETLASLGYRISAADIARGVARVKWPGRFQILNYRPVVLVDGAHNVASMMRLVENIKAYFNYGQIFLIIGSSCDKDIPGMVKELVSLSPRVIATHSSHPRAASPSIVAAEFLNRGIKAGVSDTVAQAISQALSLTGPTDLICVTGSLFMVAETLDYFSVS
jgi:dihydrofolate synthase / folylpolyglutamate synthase